MKFNFLLSIFISILFTSCSSSRNSIANTQEDKALLSAIKKFNKKSGDEDLQVSIKELYNEAAKVHLDNIDVYNSITDVTKWDKLLREYGALQHLTDIINESASAKRLIDPPSYVAQIETLKLSAASDYYVAGEDYAAEGTKAGYQAAYHAFNKSQQYSPGFKDVARKISDAYQKAVLDVVINPVSDNSFYYDNAGYNRYGNSFNNDYLQRNLVSDLGGSNRTNTPARYYTTWDARRLNLVPDMVVDLTWVDLTIPQPFTSSYSRNVSKQIQVGKDTSGAPIYQTVSGTLYITKRYFTASGDLESRITKVDDGNLLDLRRFNSQFNWEQEAATYRGDQRALSSYELSILGNSQWRVPSKDQILEELYQRIYPQVKNEIYTETRW